MRMRIEIASAASWPRNDGEKWDSPNQRRLLRPFGPRNDGMTCQLAENMAIY